jgi:hypothetical protein
MSQRLSPVIHYPGLPLSVKRKGIVEYFQRFEYFSQHRRAEKKVLYTLALKSYAPRVRCRGDIVIVAAALFCARGGVTWLFRKKILKEFLRNRSAKPVVLAVHLQTKR